jgi:hypothetical protein
MFPKYDNLKSRVLELIAEGKLPSTPTREQRIEIAYHNARFENADVTIDMVERAVDSPKR